MDTNSPSPIDWAATDDFHPEDTDSTKDFEKNEFLDLRRPLLAQVWYANFRYVFGPFASVARLKEPLARVSTSNKSTNRAISHILLACSVHLIWRYDTLNFSSI